MPQVDEDSMKENGLLLDLGVGLLAGLAATKVTEYGQEALWALTPENIKEQEERVRPGPPFRVAAEKTAALADLDLDQEQIDRAGMAFHYASGVAWGTVYCLVRRAAGMDSLGAGIATGTSMSIILDELVTPALGFSAPNRDYPTATHLRGFVGHLLYGTALAATAELLYRLAERGATAATDEQQQINARSAG
jgi:uncharacterized membrane protein YagU involved in acid resistance